MKSDGKSFVLDTKLEQVSEFSGTSWTYCIASNEGQVATGSSGLVTVYDTTNGSTKLLQGRLVFYLLKKSLLQAIHMLSTVLTGEIKF